MGPESRRFSSLRDAHEFMKTEVDRPVEPGEITLDNGFKLDMHPHFFDDGTFTNSYDLNWAPEDARAAMRITPRPESMLVPAPGVSASTSATFFTFLDEASATPRQASLNLIISEGRILGMPVVDRETLYIRDGELAMDHIAASGELSLNGRTLTWAGSRTDRDAQSHVYGNGNIRVTLRRDPQTGSKRCLDETTRFTPVMPATEPRSDVGFMASADGTFTSVAVAPQGGMDIFAHDLVVRCPEGHVNRTGENRLAIKSISSLRAENLPEFAVSCGPSLKTPDFAAHPINQDPSLGTRPVFADLQAIRMVVYGGLDERTHIRLFDGRPGSSTFPGVTPAQTRDIITADIGFTWGAHVDGGGSARISIVKDGVLRSFGNRQYLKWPRPGQDYFLWEREPPGRDVPTRFELTRPGRARGPRDLEVGKHLGPVSDLLRQLGGGSPRNRANPESAPAHPPAGRENLHNPHGALTRSPTERGRSMGFS
ncbi:hypothetical protein GCM10023205_27800 [Yinghuangia aomiensis]|uniref:Phosphodiester glycosidase domain-containing protein n=1 Tax=Yinghuangia aomiensis TaxID=676205 RepID=A0ABP9H6U4_9ACTN